MTSYLTEPPGCHRVLSEGQRVRVNRSTPPRLDIECEYKQPARGQLRNFFEGATRSSDLLVD